MAAINSTTNFRVLQWCKLKGKVQRDKQKCFIVEGYHGAAEAFKVNCLIETISTEAAAPFDVPHHRVSYPVMEKISAMATPAKVAGICRFPPQREPGARIVLLDRIHHPGNLGTIIRSAVAFGADTVVLNESVDIYNPKVIQASQGMLFHANVIKHPIKAFMLELKEAGYQLIGTGLQGGVSPDKIKAAPRRALLIGNEGDGVGASLLTLCDVTARIPMDPRCESLNVGVAASILLYALDI